MDTQVLVAGGGPTGLTLAVDLGLRGVRCELVSFTQDRGGVAARVKDRKGAISEITADYLVGCDGGASVTRKQLGILLSGNQDRMLQLRQSLHYCEGLFDRIAMGKGRHYHVADNHATQFIVQDST